MNLVDEQNGVRLAAESFEHLLNALLEVAAITRARQQRPEVERVHFGALQHVGDLACLDPKRKTLGQRRLADARLAHQQRIVLPAPAENLDHPLELEGAANQRIDLPSRRTRDQVRGELVQRIRRCRHAALRPITLRRRRLALSTVRDDPQQRETSDSVPSQEVRRVALFLLKHEDQETPRIHMLGTRDRSVHDSLLNDTIEANRRFGLGGGRRRHRREGLGQHFVHLPSQHVEIHATHRQHLPPVRFIGDGAQQVLERHRVVAVLGRQAEGTLDRLQRFGRERNRRLRHY